MERVFTVVIPAYGGGELWKAAVNSVLMQDYPFIELVFTDDGTPGFDANTVKDFIEAHKKKNLVNYLVLQQKENRGTVQNLRNAHTYCSGYYFTHIAMDDVYCNEKVLSQYAAALDDKPKDVLGVYARALVCNEQLEPLGYTSFDTEIAKALNHATAKEQYDEMTKSCCIHMGATAFIREEFMATGDFDPNYRLMEDWPFFLNTMLAGKRFEYHDFDALFYRNGGVTDADHSTTPRRMFREDHLRMYERIILPNLNLLKPRTRILVCSRYEESRIVIERHYGSLSKIRVPMRIVCKLAYVVESVTNYIYGRRKLFALWAAGIILIALLKLGILVMLIYTTLLVIVRKMRKHLKNAPK